MTMMQAGVMMTLTISAAPMRMQLSLPTASSITLLPAVALGIEWHI
jgi:hypothetical protein